MRPLLPFHAAAFADSLFDRLPAHYLSTPATAVVCREIRDSLTKLSSFAGSNLFIRFPHLPVVIADAWNGTDTSSVTELDFEGFHAGSPSVNSLAETDMLSLLVTVFSPLAPLIPAGGRWAWNALANSEAILDDECHFGFSEVSVFAERIRLRLQRQVSELHRVIDLISPDLFVTADSLIGVDSLARLTEGITLKHRDFFPIPTPICFASPEFSRLESELCTISSGDYGSPL
jgi:hypothetical protein